MISNILRGTNRKEYTSSKVRKMRLERLTTKAKKDGITNEQVQQYLGKLQAAGHLRLSNMTHFDVEMAPGANPGTSIKSTRITINTYGEKGFGDKPHMVGYLQSASDSDKQYKLKGWFNEDGTIRIELVN